MKETDSTQAANTALAKTCGEVEFRLGTAPQDDTADLPAITLSVVAADGTETPIAAPDEMAGYVPVGLGCAVAESDGKPYFAVQYGELSGGCAFCEWFYLYDGAGRQLTRSDPPLLEDETLPPAQRQSPNNAEYEAMLGQLGIPHPEVDYIE